MNKKQIIALVIVFLAGAGISFRAFNHLSPAPTASPEHGHGHEAGGQAHPDPDHAEDKVSGPHGGRLLQKDDFELEITIFERGIPPQFRVYSSKNHQPIDPTDISLTIDLERLGGRTDTFTFKPEQDYLAGDPVVVEPHSFRVKVQARHSGKNYAWEYDSFEGRTELSPAMIEQSGITIEKAGARDIYSWVSTYGRIAPNEDQLAYVMPRFPGRVEAIHKRLGDSVAQDELLAVIQSTESLQSYPVKSPLSGTIIEKNVTAGELTSPHQIIYTVGNLETVWVDLQIYPKDFTRIRIGQRTTVAMGDHLPAFEGAISYISPFATENNQTMLARLVLPNPEGQLRPGIFISARVETEKTTVPVAVKRAALQTFRDWQVVFMKEGNEFEVRPVELGRRDDQWVEILSGLDAGQEYAAENSFIIKADILKSGAAHDH